MILAGLPPNAAQAFAVARRVADKIILSLAASFAVRSRVDESNQPPIDCSVQASVDGVVFDRGNLAISALLKLADQTIYLAMQAGGNQACLGVFDGPPGFIDGRPSCFDHNTPSR